MSHTEKRGIDACWITSRVSPCWTGERIHVTTTTRGLLTFSSKQTPHFHRGSRKFFHGLYVWSWEMRLTMWLELFVMCTWRHVLATWTGVNITRMLTMQPRWWEVGCTESIDLLSMSCFVGCIRCGEKKRRKRRQWNSIWSKQPRPKDGIALTLASSLGCWVLVKWLLPRCKKGEALTTTEERVTRAKQNLDINSRRFHGCCRGQDLRNGLCLR